MEKAIVCVDMDPVVLRQLEQLVLDDFGNDYVVEIAEKPSEAITVIQTLQSIGINTAILITGFYMPEYNGLHFLEQVHQINSKTKIILFTRKMVLVSVEDIINSINIFKIIKTNYKRDEILQVIKDACYSFNQEMELERLYTMLKDSENEKKLILESIAEGMVFIDQDYNILWMNERIKSEFKNNYNKCHEKLYGRSRPCPECECMGIFNGEPGYTCEKSVNDDKYKLVKYYPVKENSGSVLGILMSLTDITSKKKIEKMNNVLLEVAKLVYYSDAIVQLYEAIYEIISKELSANYMCVAGKDYDNVYIEYINGKDKLLSVKGLKYKDHQRIIELMNSLMKQVQEDDKNNYIITDREHEVEIVIGYNEKIMIFVFDNTDLSVEYLFTFIRALSDQIKIGVSKIESIKKITYQAHHDSLTGLYNREFFMKTVNGKIFSQREREQEQTRYSLAVLDLNYFKEVNDTYGHVFGDEVLFTVAGRILKSLRHGDIVARIGGDEFAILIQQTSKTEVTKILTRIQELIAEPIEIGKTRVVIGSSIGLVYEVSKYTSSELALKDADIAMYEAKRNKAGIGTFRFYEKEIEEKLHHQRVMENNLKNASVNKEFSLHYQPIMSLKNNQIVGFEAFIRWENMDGIYYNPSEFLPIAEDSGHFEDIGNFVLEQVSLAMDILSSHELYKDCFVSINLSTKQLFSSQQIDKIERLGLHRKKIQIEVTEKTLFDNFDKANKSLEKLKSMGVKVHLDDFGTGYSSLSCLNTTEINDIKIDRTFVKQLPHSLNCSKVVNVILSVAKGLGMTVTAEGVEDKEQLDFLYSVACDYAQGFYISKPLTLDEVLQFQNNKLVMS
ncbi:MAG: hypothetical protein CVU84_07155 [Firmicutes bacterium HGW-Firmicutes-1]|jgi:diguanylate cyclase (GGDEF)-like protein|nr:MAG: hypothetical protein CVU84_07155 [Firmicutes bacterium HGW-Firmicutes-1]